MNRVSRIPFLVSRIFLLFALFFPLTVIAHELRPAYLELREGSAGEFRVLWKTPMREEMRLALAPEFSGRIEELTPVATRQTGEAAVQTWRIRALEPLRGQSVRIGGLETSIRQEIYQPFVGYRVVGGGTKFDVIGAARYTQIDTELNLTVTTGGLLPGGTRSVSEGESW
ncbi:MAG: hypothetical protein ACRET7_01800 [Burkholderiales bacterium]